MTTSNPVREIAANPPEGMTNVQVPLPGGQSLAVQVWGAGPSVLLLHGIPGSAGVWRNVASGLVARGFRVLVPDLLGFGASSRPSDLEGLWLDAQVDAVRELLSLLAPDGAIVVGHDYGAPAAVLLADRVPGLVSALVLAAGNVLADTPIPPPLNTLRWPVVGAVTRAVLLSPPALRALLRMGNATPQVTLPGDVYLGDARQQRAIATIFAGALRDLPRRYAPVEAALGTLPQPAVVLWGDRDRFFPLAEGRRAAARVAHGRLRVLPKAGHFLPAERPEAFVDAVAELAATKDER